MSTAILTRMCRVGGMVPSITTIGAGVSVAYRIPNSRCLLHTNPNSAVWTRWALLITRSKRVINVQNVQTNALFGCIWRKVQPNQCSILRNTNDVTRLLACNRFQFDQFPHRTFDFRGTYSKYHSFVVLDSFLVHSVKAVTGDAIATVLRALAISAVAVLTNATDFDCFESFCSFCCTANTGTFITGALAINASTFLALAHFDLFESHLGLLSSRLSKNYGRKEKKRKYKQTLFHIQPPSFKQSPASI